LSADGGGEFGVIEPRDVIEENREQGIFDDVEDYGDLIAARVEVVFNVSEETGVNELIRGGLQSVAIDLRVYLKLGDGDDLGLGQSFEAIYVDFMERGRGWCGGLSEKGRGKKHKRAGRQEV